MTTPCAPGFTQADIELIVQNYLAAQSFADTFGIIRQQVGGSFTAENGIVVNPGEFYIEFPGPFYWATNPPTFDTFGTLVEGPTNFFTWTPAGGGLPTTWSVDDSIASIAAAPGAAINGPYAPGDTILTTDGGQIVRIDTDTNDFGIPLQNAGPGNFLTTNGDTVLPGEWYIAFPGGLSYSSDSGSSPVQHPGPGNLTTSNGVTILPGDWYLDYAGGLTIAYATTDTDSVGSLALVGGVALNGPYVIGDTIITLDGRANRPHRHQHGARCCRRSRWRLHMDADHRPCCLMVWRLGRHPGCLRPRRHLPSHGQRQHHC